jgi:hypothetical protein
VRVGEGLDEGVDSVRFEHSVAVHHHHKIVGRSVEPGIQRRRFAAVLLKGAALAPPPAMAVALEYFPSNQPRCRRYR